jgi:hypothetical protein
MAIDDDTVVAFFREFPPNAQFLLCVLDTLSVEKAFVPTTVLSELFRFVADRDADEPEPIEILLLNPLARYRADFPIATLSVPLIFVAKLRYPTLVLKFPFCVACPPDWYPNDTHP